MTTFLQVSDNAKSRTPSGELNNTTSPITLNSLDTTNLPAVTTGYIVTIWDDITYPYPGDDPNMEQAFVSAITIGSSGTLTLTRSNPKSHTGDPIIALLGIARHISDLNTAVNNAETSLSNKVDKVTGKALSTNDYTDGDKLKLDNILGTNTGDQTISDATISLTNITTNNTSTTKHGFAPILPDDDSKYLDGKGNWTDPIEYPVGQNGDVQFNDNGAFGHNVGFTYDQYNQRVVVGVNAVILPDNPLALTGTVDSYLQSNLQNKSDGTYASADYIITADNGDDTQNYADFGLAGSNYANETWDSIQSNDTYTLADGGNYVISTLTPDKTIKFAIANTIHESHPEDIVGEVDTDGINLVTGKTFRINGVPVTSGGGSFTGTMDDITDGTTYVKTHNDYTSAEKTIVGNTSNTNSGDNATNSQYSGLAASKEDTGVAASAVSTHNSATTGIHGSGANSLIFSNDSRLTDARTPSAHNQAESTITFTDITTGNVSTSSHGFMPKLPTAAGKYLRDDMSWQTIGGGGDMLKSTYDPTSINASAFSQDNMLDGTTNKNYTATEKTKLAGIATGATVGADWNTNVSNKPTLGTSAAKDIPAAGDASVSQVVYGTDTRLTNARTPSTHASSHVTGGSDVIANAVAAGNAGLMTGTDKTKLDGISSGANVGVVPNGAITGATKTKITYDAKGLVTSGADATTADIADSTDKRYCTDAQKTVIGNTSGANSGDNATNTQYSGLATSKEDVSNKATNFTTVNDTLYPSVKAVNDAIASAVVGLLDYRGNYNASSNLFPSTGGSGLAGALLKGDFWVVSIAGTLGGVSVLPGDQVIVLNDTPGQTASNWNLIEHDLGYTPENVSNKVTSLSGASTDTQYPSAKLVYDQLATKQPTGSYATGTGTANGTNTGDQTTIVGITGTIAQFNTACTDADFATGGGTATGTNTGDNAVNSTYASDYRAANFVAGTAYVAPGGALGTPSSGTLTNCTFPTLNQSTSGTAANLSGTPTLPNGTLATTQTAGDNSTKLATTAYADRMVPLTGSTMTGQLIAQANTNYTTAQMRNVILSTSTPTGGNNGDIWIQYTP